MTKNKVQKKVGSMLVNGKEYIKIINSKENGINNELVNNLFFEGAAPKLVLGFVSPHLNFNSIANKIDRKSTRLNSSH